MEDENNKSQERGGDALQGAEGDTSADERRASREQWIAALCLLWNQRNFALRVVGLGLVLSGVVAFAIPKRYTTSTRLMPPDSQSSSNMMMLAGIAEKTGSGLGAMAGDLLGLKRDQKS